MVEVQDKVGVVRRDRFVKFNSANFFPIREDVPLGDKAVSLTVIGHFNVEYQSAALALKVTAKVELCEYLIAKVEGLALDSDLCRIYGQSHEFRRSSWLRVWFSEFSNRVQLPDGWFTIDQFE